MGGYFDPFTGELDEAKLKASRLRVFQSMQEHLATTAIVVPRVIERIAPFSSGTAEWDGIKESLTGKSRLASLLSLDPTDTYSGALRAISLDVEFIDLSGEPLFEGLGGIQLTERFSPSRDEPKAIRELFSDPAKDARAVDIALAPLVAPAPTTRH